LTYFDYLGPNNEGCNDDGDAMNVTISTSTVTFTNETDFNSTIENENIVLTTEKVDVSFETSTESVTVIINENNSSQSDMDNSTTNVVENTTPEEVFENSTKVLIKNSTKELIETTTQAINTTVRSNLCVDSEFECCPDGKTSAQVIEYL